MVNPLPLPVRIAAGVLVTGLERLRRLPQDIPALSVTLAGQAVRTSMRVQQEIAALAGRGDELLSGVLNRPSERPAWARFDDEPVDDGNLDIARSGADADLPEDAADDRPTAAKDDGSIGADPANAAKAPSTVRRRTTSRSATAGDSTPAGPAAPDPVDMPGYQALRLAQVRTRLRTLGPDAVQRLLEYERSGAARAPFLTLLYNRLTTLSAQPGEGNQA